MNGNDLNLSHDSNSDSDSGFLLTKRVQEIKSIPEEEEDIIKTEPDLNGNDIDLSCDNNSDSDSGFLLTKRVQDIKSVPLTKRNLILVPLEKQILTPHSIYQKMLFDSHCHLDRIFSKTFKKSVSDFYQPSSQPLKKLREMYDASSFATPFEGCINIITHPKHFPTQFWDWLQA